jgi:hypothetical protein
VAMRGPRDFTLWCLECLRLMWVAVEVEVEREEDDVIS